MQRFRIDLTYKAVVTDCYEVEAIDESEARSIGLSLGLGEGRIYGVAPQSSSSVQRIDKPDVYVEDVEDICNDCREAEAS